MTREQIVKELGDLLHPAFEVFCERMRVWDAHKTQLEVIWHWYRKGWDDRRDIAAIDTVLR